MQIYDDKKKRIGTLTGFRNRSIEKTLDSGDKELSFEYPANGMMVELLKEEYYIRTKEDEFVIKFMEAGEQYNKYTARLNVEELEGQSFPGGFASKEQSVRACLTFAFDGTGWEVGTCTVTKKRTIDIEEATTAWDVLQSCLSTYRCECEIDTLNKRINIYTQIGRDRGCYFVEGLNLRKLTATSDTYEFYTRIIPIGKDGITIEWLHGKEYIENYQYSSKVKTYTWKDERYTNTTSLMEDAEAKLEELSKPYKVFAADVADLAKANQEYKNILDFGIGDTVMMVSKHPRMREKQRIVKILEYPEMPEKNKVELSNTTKTFAEVQKAETEIAKTEAILIANSSTKKVLQDYSTIEEVETKIAAAQESIELGVMHTLENHYDKTETDALIEMSKGEIELEVSKTYQTKDEMGNYSTTEETKSLIDLSVEEIEIKVSETQEGIETAAASIQLNKEKIEQKVSVGDVSAQISLESGTVTIEGNRAVITSDNFSLTKTGEVTATGKFVTTNESMELKSVQQSAGMRILHQESELGRLESGSAGDIKGIGIGTQKVLVFHNGNNIGYIYNPNGLMSQYEQRHIFAGNTFFTGDIACGGTKNRAVQTKNYGTVGMNAMESTGAFFVDIGNGVVGEDGVCYIMAESIFQETVEKEHDYYIFITGTSGKECKCTHKEKDYFVVGGEVGATFDWIIYAKQKGYSMVRMESLEVPNDAVINNEDMISIDDLADNALEKEAFEYLKDYEREIYSL